MCIQETLKLCKFPLKESVQKSVQNFFAKILQSACFCYRLSKRAIKCLNPMTGNRSKYRFRLVYVNKAFRQYA